ncbi:MAG: hypothetical protein SGILL_001099 [Bacillariaceae sp.]
MFVTLALLGGAGYAIWYFLGQPSGEDIVNTFGNIDFGDFSDVLENFTGFGSDLWNNDPFVGDNTTNVWKGTNGKGGLSLEMWNALDDTWQAEYAEAINDWDTCEPNVLTLSTKVVPVDNSCSQVDGVMKVCNEADKGTSPYSLFLVLLLITGNYGDTGWLGINEVLKSVPDQIIQSSVAKMNEYYLNNAGYDERLYTMCHEVGHGFGLPHTDENFNNADLGNCLDYTNRPKNNLRPGEYNCNRLKTMYGTVDGNRVLRRSSTIPSGDPLISASDHVKNDASFPHTEYELAMEELHNDALSRTGAANRFLNALEDGEMPVRHEWRAIKSHQNGGAFVRRLSNDLALEVHLVNTSFLKLNSELMRYCRVRGKAPETKHKTHYNTAPNFSPSTTTMFRNSGSASKPQTSNRLRRAQQLRQQRLKAKGGNASEDEETLVVSGACTVLCALLIVAAGAGLATFFFSIYQPDCIKDLSFSGGGPVVTESVVEKEGSRRLDKQNPAVASETDKVGSKESSVEEKQAVDGKGDTTTKFPLQCTSEQMDVLKRQLPPGGCEARKDKPFMRMDCSFSAATSCGDHPVWLHDFHANNNVVLDDPTSERFQAIMVGCNKAYDAVDLLRLASRDSTNRYDWEKWREEFLKTDDPREQIDDGKTSCSQQFVSVPENQSTQKAQVYCIEAMTKTFKQLEKTKKSIGYIDDELDLTHLAVRLEQGDIPVYLGDPAGAVGVGPGAWRQKCVKFPNECEDVETDKIDNWITTKPNLADGTAPIHYMSVTVEDNAYEVLQGAAKNLPRVQYLDLTYHWFGDWGLQKRSLKDLVFRLKKRGFVCYWPGEDDNMWRITDCYQEHYEIHYFANIACVNTNLAAAAPLADKMEDMFLKTLKKPFLHYGTA